MCVHRRVRYTLVLWRRAREMTTQHPHRPERAIKGTIVQERQQRVLVGRVDLPCFIFLERCAVLIVTRLNLAISDTYELASSHRET
jgi:hypothetical protein